MRHTTLTKCGASGRVIGWTNFSHKQMVHFIKIFQFYWIRLLFMLHVLTGVELVLCLAVTPS